MVSLKKKRLVFTIDRFFHIQKGVFMNILKYKGKRIRASDKNLVYEGVKFSVSMGKILL